MISPVVYRYASFMFLTLCSLVTLALAGSSLSQTKVLGSSSSIARVDAVLIVDAILGLLAVFIVVPLERIRPSAVTSRISYEIGWVATQFLLSFCSSVAVTAVGVSDVCSSTWSNILPARACGTVGALQAFSWLATFTLLFHLVFIVLCARAASARIAGIWQMSVIEVEWSAPTSSFATQSVLPTYHEKQIPVYTAGVKPLVIVEKRPSLDQPVAQNVTVTLSTQVAMNKRTSGLSTAASVNPTPPLYPQFFTSTQAHAAAQQMSPAGRTASPNPSSITSPRSGRSTPDRESATSSTPSSPVSPASDAETKVENASSSRPSSPRTKRRPPPLNLAGLSAFNAAEKSKRQARA